MPQDIPLEASETLAFTPPSLASIEGAPSFTLRAPTTRDKRYHRRLHVEEGLQHHGADAIRTEVLAGLKALWSPDAYAEHAPVIEAYWDATDAFVTEKAKDPDLQWSYDAEIEAAVQDLTQRVAQAHKPLRRMMADNADFGEMSFPLMVAVVVKNWTGLEFKPVREGGYLTLDSASSLAEALAAIEKANGLDEGAAWVELAVACTNRMYLDPDTAKNSDSPAPSPTPQVSSTTASADPGSSPESSAPTASRKSSRKTPLPA